MESICRLYRIIGGKQFLSVIMLAGGLGLLPACATVPEDPDLLALYEETNDPYEPFNRLSFEITQWGDRWFLRPVANVYRTITPTPARYGLSQFTSNLGEPYNMLYNSLQGEWSRAGNSLSRFLINSTFGIGGLFDVAGRIGIQPAGENLEDTLAVWGVPEGPYIFIPFMGPTTGRGLLARGVNFNRAYVIDGSLAPLNHINDGRDFIDNQSLILSGAGILEGRAQFIGTDRQVEESTVDLYTTFREFYRQSLRRGIANGQVPVDEIDLEEDLDIFDEEFEEEFDE